MAKKSFREQVAIKALTLPPKDAFDLRLRCLDFLIPHYSPEEHYKLIKPNVYEYYICSEGMFRLEDDDEDNYETFLKDDDRYQVELDEVECAAHDSWGFALRLTILNAADHCVDVGDEDDNDDDKEDENSEDE
jgi:hypothetical protein